MACATRSIRDSGYKPRVIDISVIVGDSTLEATVCDLASHGVAQALIAPRSGATYRMRVANDFALAHAGASNGVALHPLATLNPVEYLDWSAELERVLAAGAVGFRFFPEPQKWGVASQAF